MSENKFDMSVYSEKPQAEETNEKDGRLTNEEAILYQDYATKKEGIGFSEEADEESYAEADTLLKELSGKGIKLEGIDFLKIDLKNIAEQESLSERLEQVVAQLAVNNEDSGIMNKIGEIMGSKGMKKIVMLLSLFSILSVGAVEAQAKGNIDTTQQNHKQEMKKQETIHFHGVDASFEYDNDGNPTGCNIKMNKTIAGEEALKMEMTSRKMLVDNYVEVLMEAGMNQVNGLRGMEMTLKSERRNFLLRADLYHKLKQNNMMAEAKFVRQIMLQSIVRTEARIGAKIFDRKALGEILNSEK